MTVQLPPDIERSIQAAVLSGHFATVDDVLAEAWRLFQRHQQSSTPASGLGLIEALRDNADLLDLHLTSRTIRMEVQRSGSLPVSRVVRNQRAGLASKPNSALTESWRAFIRVRMILARERKSLYASRTATA